MDRTTDFLILLFTLGVTAAGAHPAPAPA